MKYLFYILLTLIIAIPKNVFAAMTYGGGAYTNLCGTGLSATGNTCNKGCNPTNGSCGSSSQSVVRYICDGRQTECRSNESAFTTFQSVAGVSCGKTVQIDVFSKTCRVNGGWTCGDQDLRDYMVWYSGDCAGQATPTQNPQPTKTPIPTATPTTSIISRCDEITVVSGNDTFVPATMTFRAKGSDNQGTIGQYRFYFGDGKQTEQSGAEVTHKYESSGTFRVRAEIRDSRGSWKSSTACETTVTVKSVPVIESQKSDCSNVFITEGNQTQAPTTAKFSITGYDNKGSISKYKLDFGDGTTQESSGNTFEKRYEKPGTYVIKGYVYDSQNVWKGGTNNCTTSLYVNTQPMTQQPKTGTPTIFTIFGLFSGAASVFLLGLRKHIA